MEMAVEKIKVWFRFVPAFHVPADADFPGIKALLARGRTEGWWHYEVGCGTAEWWGA
ncbi:hypothetical protein [Streptomyces sp. WAC05374]|uniref:hypothetical protein n=1 Tax=Streptomyces sp. WAC05374 TaxID=2487420 RepID=UPI0037DD26F0